MHAQAVDTRTLFPPPTWPGYDASKFITVGFMEACWIPEELENSHFQKRLELEMLDLKSIVWSIQLLTL